MTEQSIINLGLNRVDVSIEESGCDAPFYYYEYEVTKGLCLITKASDEIVDGQWSVYLFDVADEVEFTKEEDVKDLIYLITVNKKHESNRKARGRQSL